EEKVLHYLKQNANHNLHVLFHHGSNLYAYFDVDWVRDHSDRVSTTNYLLYIGINHMIWISTKESIVARPKTEARYRAIDMSTGNLTDTLQVPMGPITRSMAKRLKEAINGLIKEIWAKCEYFVSQLGRILN
ncbi:hypothetical protein J1N35_022471, partial [Gossypium stocksii]